MQTLPDDDLGLIFLNARTHSAWQGRPVDTSLLRKAWDLARMGPTGGNSQPLRIAFVNTTAAKERLLPALFEGNRAKTAAAPVTAIVAYDKEFYERLPELSPQRPESRDMIAKMPEPVRDGLAMQSAHLQAGYFIIAARALGLDCGPMGGFDRAKVDASFFADTTWRSTLLMNLGYGDPTQLYPRNPRLSFDQACQVL